MEKLLEILNELHPDIDFETSDGLIDRKILDSFDIVTIISEVSEQYDIAISAEYIIPEHFNSAKTLWQLIERLKDEN